MLSFYSTFLYVALGPSVFRQRIRTPVESISLYKSRSEPKDLKLYR